MSKDWTCCQSGRCCREAVSVTMTRGELQAVSAAAGAREVRTTWLPDGRCEVSRVDGSAECPFYEDGCTVYAVRPGVCRAFGCFGTTDGVAGMLRRVGESAGVRRVAVRMMDAADAWTAGCE